MRDVNKRRVTLPRDMTNSKNGGTSRATPDATSTDSWDETIKGAQHIQNERMSSWTSQLHAWRSAQSLSLILETLPKNLEVPEVAIQREIDVEFYDAVPHDSLVEWGDNPTLIDQPLADLLTRDPERWVIAMKPPTGDNPISKYDDLIRTVQNAIVRKYKRTEKSLKRKRNRAAVPGVKRSLIMIDSGASQDMVGEDSRLKGQTFTSIRPINIETARGVTRANVQTKLEIPQLGITVEPYVLPDCPDVLSQGQLSAVHGYDYLWKGFAPKPRVFAPDGREIEVIVDNFVPFVVLQRDGKYVLSTFGDQRASNPNEQADEDRPTKPQRSHATENALHDKESEREGKTENIQTENANSDEKTNETGASTKNDAPDPKEAEEHRVETTRFELEGNKHSTEAEEERRSRRLALPSTEPTIEALAADPAEETELVEEVEQETRRKTKKNAPDSIEHLMTHQPPHEDCPICVEANARLPPHRRRPSAPHVGIDKFGDMATMDLIDPKMRGEESFDSDQYALLILDVSTKFWGVFPVKSKNTQTIEKAIVGYIGTDSRKSMRAVYSDREGGFSKALENMATPQIFHIPGSHSPTDS